MQVDVLLLGPPDLDMGMHLLEVVPDHHRGVLLVVQPSDDQSAGYMYHGETEEKFLRKPALRVVSSCEAGG